jgi:hypothetical protein
LNPSLHPSRVDCCNETASSWSTFALTVFETLELRSPS